MDDTATALGLTDAMSPAAASNTAEDLGVDDVNQFPAASPPEAKTTFHGLMRNVGAGLVDAGSGLLNILSDPSGNLIGKPLATAAITAHDALAPVLGYERFPPEFRQFLHEDNVAQPGTKLTNAASDVVGVPRTTDIPAATPTERVARKMTTGAGLMAGAGPLAALSGATGAAGGDVLAGAAPDWAKPGAELAGNIIGGAAPSLATAGLEASRAAVPVVGAGRRVGQMAADAPRELSVGRTLNQLTEPAQIESSPVGPLSLAQATNNPEIAARGDIAPGYNAEANAALLGAQQKAIQSQIGQIGPSMTSADASSAGVGAIRQLRDIAREREGQLWNVPALTDHVLETAPIKASAASALQAIGKDDPGLLLGMTGDIKGALEGIRGLPDQANLQNINSFLGVLKGVQRRPPPDNARAGALAGRLVNSLEKTNDDLITAPGTPPEVSSAYQAARDFTRQRASVFGTQDMRQILNKNPAGVFTADASEAMRKFFNFSNGSGEGPTNIRELSDFADQMKNAWGGDPRAQAAFKANTELQNSTRGYVASALTDAARVNAGENFNPKTMQDFLRTNAPWMQSSGMFKPEQVRAAHDLLDYADMLRRPENLLRQVNSATQPRSARAETFVDQIMSPWIRHIAALTSAAGGLHQHGAMGGVIGTMLGGGFEHAVTKAESSMRSIMAQALLDPDYARALMMRASSGNRLLMKPDVRQAIDAARNGVAAGIAESQQREPTAPGVLQ